MFRWGAASATPSAFLDKLKTAGIAASGFTLLRCPKLVQVRTGVFVGEGVYGLKPFFLRVERSRAMSEKWVK